MNTRERDFTIGTQLCQTIAVFTAMVQSTRLTQSLTQSIMKMNARALRPQLAGYYLVSFFLKLKQHYIDHINKGYDKAKIESEFNYKECCNDGSGLQPLRSIVFQPSSCSQRICYINDHLAHSMWLSEKVI